MARYGLSTQPASTNTTIQPKPMTTRQARTQPVMHPSSVLQVSVRICSLLVVVFRQRAQRRVIRQAIYLASSVQERAGIETRGGARHAAFRRGTAVPAAKAWTARALAWCNADSTSPWNVSSVVRPSESGTRTVGAVA